jgi:hypothetical protein
MFIEERGKREGEPVLTLSPQPIEITFEPPGKASLG